MIISPNFEVKGEVDFECKRELGFREKEEGEHAPLMFLLIFIFQNNYNDGSLLAQFITTIISWCQVFIMLAHSRANTHKIAINII